MPGHNGIIFYLECFVSKRDVGMISVFNIIVMMFSLNDRQFKAGAGFTKFDNLPVRFFRHRISQVKIESDQSMIPFLNKQINAVRTGFPFMYECYGPSAVLLDQAPIKRRQPQGFLFINV